MSLWTPARLNLSSLKRVGGGPPRSFCKTCLSLVRRPSFTVQLLEEIKEQIFWKQYFLIQNSNNGKIRQQLSWWTKVMKTTIWYDFIYKNHPFIKQYRSVKNMILLVKTLIYHVYSDGLLVSSCFVGNIDKSWTYKTRVQQVFLILNRNC